MGESTFVMGVLDKRTIQPLQLGVIRWIIRSTFIVEGGREGKTLARWIADCKELIIFCSNVGALNLNDYARFTLCCVYYTKPLDSISTVPLQLILTGIKSLRMAYK